MNENNPFAALSQNASGSSPPEINTNLSNEINNLFEQIFKITLNPFFANESKEAFVFMGDGLNNPNSLSKQNIDEVFCISYF